MKHLVLATNNAHKVKEIRAILRDAGLKMRVLTLADFPPRRPVVENKRTIEGNAIKKAVEVAKSTGAIALADDTGLFIDALGGRPGVYSARFAGPNCNFADNNRKVLRLLARVEKRRRRAVFRCVAALATPAGKVVIVEGRMPGVIAEEMRGRRGFGYDPIFYVPRLGKTLAELSPSQKNAVSHRARAFAKVPALLRRFLRSGSASPKRP